MYYEYNENDYQFKITEEDKNTTLPDEYYDIIKNKLPKISNQGKENNCLGQIMATIKYYQELIDNPPSETGINPQEYSPEFIYEERMDKMNKSGMSFNECLKIMIKQGSLPKTDYERYLHYHNEYSRTQNKKKLIENQRYYEEYAKNFCIAGYCYLSTIEQVKHGIFKYGPVFIGLPMYNRENNFWIQNDNETLMGGHAVLLVGWTTKGFILRNSWGTDWGINGYVNFPYSDFGIQYCTYCFTDCETNPNVLRQAAKTHMEKKRRSSIFNKEKIPTPNKSTSSTSSIFSIFSKKKNNR